MSVCLSVSQSPLMSIFLSSLSVCLSVCLFLSPHSCLFFLFLCLSSLPCLFCFPCVCLFFFFSFLFCPSISQFLPPASFFLCPYVCLCVSLSLSFSQSPLPTSLLVRCCIGGMVMVPIADGVCRSGRKGNKAAGCSLSLQPPPPPPLRPPPPLPPISITVCRLPVYIVDLSLQL